jgi:hypothetical protein
MLHLSRLDTRGVSRSSRNVRRDAVDVEGADRRAALFADGEVVWSWRPKVLALSPSEAEKLRGGDGGKRDGSPRRVRISRKTTARGRPECLRLYLWSRALAQSFLRGGPGCSGHPAFPAPLFFGGRSHFITRADYAARTRLHAHHCEAQRDARPIARLRSFAGSPSSPAPARATNWSGRTRIRREMEMLQGALGEILSLGIGCGSL